MVEQWKPVSGFEGYYDVSEGGRVRNVRTGHLLAPCQLHHGHQRVTLCRPGRRADLRIHRLVLEAFAGSCPEGMEGCHSDGNPEHNQISNLYWGTPKSNANDRERHGRTARGPRHGNAVLSQLDVAEIRRQVSGGRTGADIAREMGLSKSTVCRAAKGTTYADRHALVAAGERLGAP